MTMTTTSARSVISAATARRALLEAQGMLGSPNGHGGPRRVNAIAAGRVAKAASSADALQAMIERMGFVQIDTINVVERAHHLTLFSRMPEYQPNMLAELLENRRTLWEHWTHDASAIPTRWFAHWRHRFERYRRRDPAHGWWQTRMGPNPKRIISGVLTRIEREGPLMSRDFEKPRTNGPAVSNAWWQWRPTKAALEYLWRCGELAVARRINFQKVYDLTERVLADHHTQPAPEREAHVAWACRSALERLGLATPREIAAFWHAIDLASARAWCKEGLRSGELVEVVVESADGSKPVTAVALAEREPALRQAGRNGAVKKAAAGPAPDAEPMRILSPFDPVLRDRARTLRLFNFDYRFEAFVPAPKRRYGYYVMPLLQGERLVGRINPKHHRERGELAIDGVWWEKGVKPTRARKAALDAALDRLARFVGAGRVCIEK
jgi:uncharacterized protein YcaQ